MTTDKPLTEKAVAEILGVSQRTVRNLRQQGKLPYVHVSDRKIAILNSDLNEYLQHRRVAAIY